MKKIKLLLPISCIIGTTGLVAPVLASCGCSQQQNTTIPTDLLDIDGNTLKGLKEDADISKYSVLEIPTNIRIIDTGAFGTLDDVDYSNITKVIIHNNSLEIKADAFGGLTSLEEFDLSELDAGNAYALSVEDYPFGTLQNDRRYIHIKLNDNLSETAKKRVIKLFKNVGVPSDWFVTPTENNFTFNGTKENVTHGTDVIKTSLELNQFYVVNGTYSVILQKTGGSKGIDVSLDNWALNATTNDNKTLTFDSSLAVEDGHDLADGEFVTYKAIITCKYLTETKWIEILDGFKLTYVKDGDILPKTLTFDIESKDCAPGEKFKIDYKITPSFASNKDVTWTSSDPKIVSVNEKTGECSAIAGGEATITAKTVNGIERTIKVTVTADLTGLGFYGYDYDDNGNPISYSCYDDGFTGSKLVLPSTYNGCPVVDIYGYVETDDDYVYTTFAGNTSIKEVVIPNSFTDISYEAFEGCTNLEKVTFEDNSYIDEIGSEAFYGCNIKEINFGEGTVIDKIDSLAFGYNTSLSTIILPNVYNIYYDAFNGTAIKTTTEGNINYLKANGSDYYVALNIDYPSEQEAVTINFNSECRLVAWSFARNNLYARTSSNIYPVTINNLENTKIESIGYNAFYTGEKSWGNSMFPETKSAHMFIANKDLVFPDTLEYIGNYAFANFVNSKNLSHQISSITLKEGLKYIGYSSFTHNSLTSLTIPSTVEQIGEYHPFAGNTFNIGNHYYYESSGAFAWNESLTSITFADNSKLKLLGEYTFFGCSSVSGFTLPNKLEIIGTGSLCFHPIQNNSLGAARKEIKITIPSSVEMLGRVFGGRYSGQPSSAIDMIESSDINLIIDYSEWYHYYDSTETISIVDEESKAIFTELLTKENVYWVKNV